LKDFLKESMVSMFTNGATFKGVVKVQVVILTPLEKLMEDQLIKKDM
jgi:hypothetical protein